VSSSSCSLYHRIGLGAALGLAAVAFSAAAAAQGAAPVFSVNKVECDWLDRSELTRLLELELALVGTGEDLPPLTVDLVCTEQGVTIVVRDPEWTQQIERTVPSPEIEGPGRERQIALTVAQFAGALWRLREAEEQETARAKEPEEPIAEPAPTAEPPPPETTETDEQPGLPWSLELGGGIRGRALSPRPLVTGYGEVGGVVWLIDRVGVAALIAVEGTRADRAGGHVGAVAVSAGMGLAGLLAEAERFRLEARLVLAGGYARFEGHADDPTSHRDESTGGGAGEVRIEIDPALVLGRFHAALVVQAGYALPVTIAVVREDDDVSFSGWWIGAGLRVAYSP
jgi:hypothetical protein